MSEKDFDPNAAATHDGVFGLPEHLEHSKVILLPIPWEATTSYGGGTSKGPEAIRRASMQVDLFDQVYGNFYERGIYMMPLPKEIKELNREAKAHAQKIIKAGGDVSDSKQLRQSQKRVNELGETLNRFVEEQARIYLDEKKVVGVVGGDHSVPFGLIKALAKKHFGMSILHIDAHADLRKAFEGFTWSHASIMYNVHEHISRIGHLAQVGLRDFCEAEYEYAQRHVGRIKWFTDREIARDHFRGRVWDDMVSSILAHLPEDKPVYISFDIDGLDRSLCPNTGTPVPGGLSYQQATYLIETVAKNRVIVGFDLNEVSPREDEWDANVGARILYQLIGATLFSQQHKNDIPHP